VHEEAADVILDDLLSGPEGGQILRMFQRNLRAGDVYDPELVNAIGQERGHPTSWTAAQVATFGRIYVDVMGGRVAHVGIYVGGGPYADRARAKNAARLSAAASPFVATLDMEQNGHTGDGWLRWTEPISLHKSTGLPYIEPDGSELPLYIPTAVAPGSVPLEVGTSKASVTYWHLRLHGGVARWPYGSNWIRLLLDTKRFPHNPGLVPAESRALTSEQLARLSRIG